MLELTSAVIASDRTLSTLRTESGARIREHVHVRQVGARQVETDDETIEARAVVVCAGPWTRALVPRLATTTTLEHAGYLRTDAPWPIFIDFTQPAVYGLPTPGSDLYKVAVHHGGAVVDPDAEFVADAAAVDALRAAIAQRLPGAVLEHVDVCPYDNTADEHFIVDRVDGIVVGAGTSGHAFKFGPLLGEQLADLVMEGS